MAKPKKDHVSASFHYLVRSTGEDDNNYTNITKEEFDEMCEGLLSQQVDEESPEQVEQLRYNHIALIKKAEMLDPNTIAGLYENAYSGHSFRNSDKGAIDANSLNFRPFFFLLYLSKQGRLYIASQYLGSYGGYLALKNTIEKLFKNKKGLSFRSFNMFTAQLDKVLPKEVIFEVSKLSDSITGENVFSQNVAIALKSHDKSGHYEKGIKDKILSLVGLPAPRIREELSKFLEENELIAFEDSQIESCKVLATHNKNKFTIHMLDGSNHATKFPLNVEAKTAHGGHPSYEEVKSEVLSVLENEILKKHANV